MMSIAEHVRGHHSRRQGRRRPVSRVDVASWDSRPVPAVAGGTLPPARSIWAPLFVVVPQNLADVTLTVLQW